MRTQRHGSPRAPQLYHACRTPRVRTAGAARRNPPGRLQLWVIDPGGTLWSCWKSSTSSKSVWTPLSRFVSDPVRAVAAAPLRDRRLQLWTITRDGELLSAWKQSTDSQAPWW